MVKRTVFHLPEALKDLEPALLDYCEKTGKDPETVTYEALRVALSPLLRGVQLPKPREGALTRQEPLTKLGTGLPMARERTRGHRPPAPKKKAAKKAPKKKTAKRPVKKAR
jgi:hypothetical protein